MATAVENQSVVIAKSAEAPRALRLQMPTCHGIDIEDLSITQLQKCLTERKFSARDLVETYLERIEQLNGLLKWVSCVFIRLDPTSTCGKLCDFRPLQGPSSK